jgi:hypothetical protein
MRGEKRLRAALPHLNAEELRMVWKDCRRAQDVVAIGGGTSAEWNKYVALADDIWRELEKRFPEDARKPIDYTKSWTPEEYDALAAIHRRIQKGVVGGSAK